MFIDKHGQLGIWDARAPADEVADEDEDVTPANKELGGKSWRLQVHWPATSKSSLSSIRIDPIDSHSVSQLSLVFNRSLQQLPQGVYDILRLHSPAIFFCFRRIPSNILLLGRLDHFSRTAPFWTRNVDIRCRRGRDPPRPSGGTQPRSLVRAIGSKNREYKHKPDQSTSDIDGFKQPVFKVR